MKLDQMNIKYGVSNFESFSWAEWIVHILIQFQWQKLLYTELIVTNNLDF